MPKRLKKPNPNLQAWIDARKRHRLSHVQVQMARELGMNPKKLGRIDNHKLETWKQPLPQFIEHLYLKRFGRKHPDMVMSIEQLSRLREEKKELKRTRKQERKRHLAEESEK